MSRKIEANPLRIGDTICKGDLVRSFTTWKPVPAEWIGKPFDGTTLTVIRPPICQICEKPLRQKPKSGACTWVCVTCKPIVKAYFRRTAVHPDYNHRGTRLNRTPRTGDSDGA